VAGRRARPARRRRHGYAQHFLRSSRDAAELVRASEVTAGDLVVEIGAGAGVLTEELARCAAVVVAVELDRALAARLGRRFASSSSVVVLCGDAVELPLPAAPFRVVANVPFNRTTAILHRLLDDPGTPLVRADLVVQEAVARKRTSPRPSTLLDVCWGALYEFRLGRRLAAYRFRPPPSCDAAVLTIVRRERPLVEDHEAFCAFAGDGFTRPGGTLLRTLRQLVPPQELKRLGRELGFAPDGGPERLDAEQWAALFARAVER
jgi:23S rRNA (adenine-N6)-dimethyltransferase